MKNEGAVVIRQAMTAVGVGLVEEALRRESGKGCSPVLCMEPVGLEPPYVPFDAQRMLAGPCVEQETSLPRVEDWMTVEAFPAAEDVLSLSWMETVLRALAVLPGPLAFEVLGSRAGIAVRFGVPVEQVAGVRAAVLGHFPLVRLREVVAPFPSGAPVVEEVVPVGPYHRSLSLLGREGASPLGLAVQVLSELPREACGLVQVLFQPADAGHDWHFNVERLAEAEERAVQLAQLGGLSSGFAFDPVLPPLGEPGVQQKVREEVGFYAVVLRYAVWGGDATAFCQGMRVATGMLRFGNRAWRVLEHETFVEALGEEALARMVTQRLAHRPGVMLTSRELASLVHLPDARVLTLRQEVHQRHGWEWQPYPEAESVLGRNVFAGTERVVALPRAIRLRHTYVAGTTGSGKSKLLERMAVDDVLAGRGLCLVDPHGDLCRDVLSRIPAERWAEVVVVSFGVEGWVPRWNPFAADVGSGKFADDMTRAFLAQAGTTGPRMEHHFRMLAYVVHALQGTLEEFAELASVTPKGLALREAALDKIGNPQVQRFLRQELPKIGPRELASVTNKLSRLLLDDGLGAMFRQRENTLAPRRWMDEGKIVLIDLASGVLGADHARFVGSMLVSLLYRAALSRASVPEAERVPFYLYLDEFQRLQAATLGEMLSEGRKYGLGLVLAHQERGQLSKELGQALGNCATKVVFRPAEDDLPHTLRLLARDMEPRVLRELGVGEAVVVSGDRTASLQTELCQAPVVRDPWEALRAYAQEQYLRVGDDVALPRRPRVYDTFGGAGDAT